MLKYIDVIPSRESVPRGEALNILGGVANDGDATRVDISVWGRVDEAWEALATARTEIGAGEHKHLYFTLGPECFSADRWRQEIEDIELRIGDRRPGPQDRGIIVFIEG